MNYSIAIVSARDLLLVALNIVHVATWDTDHTSSTPNFGIDKVQRLLSEAIDALDQSQQAINKSKAAATEMKPIADKVLNTAPAMVRMLQRFICFDLVVERQAPYDPDAEPGWPTLADLQDEASKLLKEAGIES